MGMMQEFQKADKERRGEVATMGKEVATMLKEFAKGDTERRSELTNRLNNEMAAMHNGVATMLGDFAEDNAKRRSEVKTMQDEVKAMLGDFAKGDAERRSEVTNSLRNEVATMRNGVATMFNDFAEGDAERRSDIADYIHSEVASMRSGVATMFKDLAKADAERQSEVAAIHEMVWGKVPAKKMAPPPVEELPKEMPPEKAVVEEAPVGELRDQVFQYLANHPDGTKLVELEEEFGLARIQIAKVIRGLMDDNKVEKRDLFYFAI